MKFNYEIANDIGNSQVKMDVNDNLLKQPSTIKYLLSKPSIMEGDVHKIMNNLENELMVTITSSAIKRSGIYILGKKATITTGDNMNIRLGKKYKHDIPVIMTLGMIAAQGVKEYYEENGNLTDIIHIDCKMSTAIPMSEYTVDNSKVLANRFKNDNHVVIVHIGKKQITVSISFKEVKVTKEGVPPLYALIDLSSAQNSDTFKYYEKKYKQPLTSEELSKMKIFHIDIGDGTTEYIYTNGMNAVQEGCSGERRGVGHATEDALKLLLEDTNGYITLNRQQFIEATQSASHTHHKKAVQYLQEAKHSQTNKILEDIQEKATNDTGGNVDIISVYGGGSIQFKELLFDEVLEFCNDIHCKLLWIPEEYAVDLNMRGLKVLNKKIWFNKK